MPLIIISANKVIKYEKAPLTVLTFWYYERSLYRNILWDLHNVKEALRFEQCLDLKINCIILCLSLDFWIIINLFKTFGTSISYPRLSSCCYNRICRGKAATWSLDTNTFLINKLYTRQGLADFSIMNLKMCKLFTTLL